MADSAKDRGADRERDGDRKVPARSDRLENFEQRLGRVRGQRDEAPDGAARASAMGTAFRISTELIAGLVVGGFIGWQLDAWLGTSPALLLVFFILGAAAGIWNVIRTAYGMQPGARANGANKVKTGTDPREK